jgi:hypothetical protein
MGEQVRFPQMLMGPYPTPEMDVLVWGNPIEYDEARTHLRPVVLADGTAHQVCTNDSLIAHKGRGAFSKRVKLLSMLLRAIDKREIWHARETTIEDTSTNRGMFLIKSQMRYSSLKGADLRGLQTISAGGGKILTLSMAGSFLAGAVWAGSRLTRADLRGCFLHDAVLSDAVLDEADL